MTLVQQRCPACSAPLPLLQPGESRLTCAYCGSALRIERHGDEIAVEVAKRVLDRLDENDAQAQDEFRRLRLTQKMANVEMSLANVQREMRAIQRGPINPVARKQLEKLHQESIALQKQIAELNTRLNPNAAAPSSLPERPKLRLSGERLTWLFFSLDGRATRSEFWAGIFVFFAIFVILAIPRSILTSLLYYVDGGIMKDVLSGLLYVSNVIQFVLYAWVAVVVGVKRFHDRDKSGWWMFIGLIPAVGLFWLLVELGFLAGTPGPNQYGDPGA